MILPGLTLTPARVKSKRRGGLLVVAVLLFGIVAGGIFGLRHLGLWLEVDEPLQHARAIAVLGGGFPYRAAEAANLYRAGWAQEVWLTRGSLDDRDRSLAEFGIPITSEHESGRWLLLKLGVPAGAIRLVPEPVNNTLSELQAILRYAQNGPSGPLIIVTSRAHSRRVRVIWNTMSADRLAMVRYTPRDRYNAAIWWHDSKDALETFRETFGILNAWAGFPIAPRER